MEDKKQEAAGGSRLEPASSLPLCLTILILSDNSADASKPCYSRGCFTLRPFARHAQRWLSPLRRIPAAAAVRIITQAIKAT
jgi:hypothetical protein